MVLKEKRERTEIGKMRSGVMFDEAHDKTLKRGSTQSDDLQVSLAGSRCSTSSSCQMILFPFSSVLFPCREDTCTSCPSSEPPWRIVCSSCWLCCSPWTSTETRRSCWADSTSSKTTEESSGKVLSAVHITDRIKPRVMSTREGGRHPKQSRTIGRSGESER